jgi:DNA-binding CsgD family transcriptional regulator
MHLNDIIKLSLDIAEFSRELMQQSGITHFEHTRTYRNGKSIFICSNPYYMERFFIKKYSRPEPEIYEKSSTLLWNGIPSLLAYDQQIQDLQNNFNVDHGICFLEVHKDYIETRNFATTNNRPEMVNFYLNNTKLLDQFFNAYLDRFKNDFLHVGQTMPNIPLRPKNFAIQMQTNYIFKDITKRELECLTLLAQGLTAKMIAHSLKISSRTIEKHIENIKEKTGLKYKTEIICKFLEWKNITSPNID